jgi:hypothetical protein
MIVSDKICKGNDLQVTQKQDMITRMRRKVLLLAIVAIILLCSSKPTNSDDALRHWNPQAAATYLDERLDWWLSWSGSERGSGTACLSCHTATPYALARPALNQYLGAKLASAAETKLIDNVNKRIANWEHIVSESNVDQNAFAPYYSGNRKSSSLGTEAVLNALVLVNYDVRIVGGRLSERSQKALDIIWRQQQKSGAWLWLDFGLNPWEKDGAYYGAALAAMTVGTAGSSYYDADNIRPKVTALTSYLRTNSPDQPLHHRLYALWASSHLPNIFDEAAKRNIIDEVRGIQQSDGGWNLATLGLKSPHAGEWRSFRAFPDGSISDGYATGLIVLALKRANVTTSDPILRKAIDWLVANQKDGTWPVNYVNQSRDPNDKIGMFMRDAATAFSVLALTDPPKSGAPKP